MPLVKNTIKGNNYLVKINTDGDICSRTAIRSYNRQYGYQGTSGDTVFRLPFNYDPGSHTLWVFVNGEKAVVDPTHTLPNVITYAETDKNIVTFGNSRGSDDIIEFIVAGSYLNDEEVGGTSGGGLTWVRIDDDVTATEFYGYLVDTTTINGAVTITLPATPLTGTIIGVEDTESNFGSVNCTIARNGNTIMGVAEDLILDENNQGLQLVYDGVDDWRITWATPHINTISILSV